MKRKQALLVALLLIPVAFLATACTQDVNADSDQLACVYDGSKTGGHRFLQEVQPGNHIKTDKANEVVFLPTSNRFYEASQNEDTRDTLAPIHYEAFATGHVPVFVEGQIRFRFNTSGNKACEWYAKHGRRNAGGQEGLGFNVRGRVAQANAGWFRFLAENFGTTMSQVVKDSSGEYTWQQLTYGSDPGAAHKVRGPVDIAYGKHLGAIFNERLRGYLGGDYFCGTDPSLTGQSPTEPCPTIYFQVESVKPVDESLIEAHQTVVKKEAQLQAAQATAALDAQNRASILAHNREQRKVLESNIENARLTELGDADVQKCLILAKVGLDCDGHKQTIIVGGSPAGTGGQ